MRLGSLITMLVVVYFLMIRMRDPGMWGLFASDDEGTVTAGQLEAKEKTEAKTEKTLPAKSEAKAEAKTEAKTESPPAVAPSDAKTAAAAEPPVPPALTDRDPEEWEEFRHDAQALDHNSLFIKPEEIPIYTRLVRWVDAQSRDELFERAKAEEPVTFNDFRQFRDELVGRLVFLDLNVRQVKKTRFTSERGQDLYEVWGFTNDSRGALYCVVTVGLPADFPVGLEVQQHALIAGYFMKMQGYEPVVAKPGERYHAPLIVGRVMSVAVPKASGGLTLSFQTGVIVLSVCALLILGGTAWGIFVKRKPRGYRELATTIPRPDVVPVDEWFDHIEPGTGNNSPPNGESSEGPGHRGEGNGQIRSTDRLDSDPKKNE